MARILVIGGMNMDIGGHSTAKLLSRDSNIGTVTMSPGGVGYNIARDLRLLGEDTAMLSVLGEDGFADTLCRDALGRGLDLSLLATAPKQHTSTYLYVLDSDGDMTAAVNDMAVCEAMTPSFFAARLEAIQRFDMIVLDANLPQDSIEWLCQRCTAPLIADPVSVAKGWKLQGVLDKLFAIKPNAMEAELLCGMPVRDDASARAAVDKLLDMGLHQVYLSMGRRGIYAGDRDGGHAHFERPEVDVVDTTGGGDAMVAALSATLLRGGTLEEAAQNAICAGAFACTAVGAVHPDLSWDNIEKLRRSEEIQ